MKPTPTTNNHQAVQQHSPSIVTPNQTSSAGVPNAFQQSVLKLEETLDKVIKSLSNTIKQAVYAQLQDENVIPPRRIEGDLNQAIEQEQEESKMSHMPHQEVFQRLASKRLTRDLLSILKVAGNPK